MWDVIKIYQQLRPGPGELFDKYIKVILWGGDCSERLITHMHTTHTHACTHAYAHTCMRARIHTHMHAYTHAHAHAHTHIHTINTQTHTHKQKQTHTHKQGMIGGSLVRFLAKGDFYARVITVNWNQSAFVCVCVCVFVGVYKFVCVIGEWESVIEKPF